MLLFTEGFDWANAIASYTSLGKWLDQSGPPSFDGTVPRFPGGQYLNLSANSRFMRRALGTNLAAGTIGFALSRTASTLKSNILVLFDTTANVQLGILMNADGTLSVFRGTHANVLGTSTWAYSGTGWVYVEFKFAVANSVGATDVIVYVDETPVITLAAAADTQETANAYVTHMCFGGPTPTVTGGGAAETHIDDVYVINHTGAINNAPLGNVRVQTIFPNANGATSGFTGSDGNSVDNYLLVDETNYSAADYVDGAAVGNKDTYGFGDLAVSTGTVYGVSVNINGLRTDTDPRSVAPVVRHSGTDYDGSNIALAAGATWHQQAFETNPGTGVAWTVADVNGAEIGMKVTV